jgi:hemoglobin
VERDRERPSTSRALIRACLRAPNGLRNCFRDFLPPARQITSISLLPVPLPTETSRPMHRKTLKTFALLTGIGLLPACPADPAGTDTDATGSSSTSSGDPTGDPSGDPTTAPTTTTNTTPGTTEDPTATTGTTTDETTTDPVTSTSTGTTGDPPLDNICTRLGGMADDGIPALVNSFLGKVLINDKINGYFLNSDIDGGALGTCVINQLGAATGCPDVVYECKTMLEAHAGLGISQNDFDDFVVDFVAALDEHAAKHPNLTDDDKTTIGTVLGSMSADIVEDATNDATVYQRVGRKPAIKALIGMPTEVGSFVDNVANNAAINNFFGATDVRPPQHLPDPPGQQHRRPDQVRPPRSPPPPIDPGVALDNPCRDMKTSHAGMQDDMMEVITIDDFLALVTDLVTAMNTFMVPMADQEAILGVLGPMCDDIVADPNTCPGNSATELTEAAALNKPIDNMAMNGAWDDKYNGKIDSMLCIDMMVPDTGLNFVKGVRLKVGMDHTYVGDITIKVIAPDNTLLTALGRPGPEPLPIPDNGVQCCGDDSNLSVTFPFTLNNAAVANGKDMGKGITNAQIVCKDENPKINPCEFKPYKGGGPGTDFNDFKGKAANGTWKVCFGDSGKGDFGKLDYIGLDIDRVKYAP